MVKKQLGRERKASMNRNIIHLQLQLSEYISGQKLDFIMSQIRSAIKKAKGHRWTYKDKAFALSLLHSSPKTYRLLQKVFHLPSVKTLKLAMNNIQVKPGFNDVILEAMQKKMANQPESMKLVSLAIDEMAIKEGISYDKRDDIIEGFSWGATQNNELANHALVFMARGITNNWKQAVGYFLSSGPMKGNEMKVLLLQCIEKLAAIGLTVVVVIADQGSNNQNLFEKLLGISIAQPYFYCNEQKVFVMYDPPHLLKNIRNNLKKHGLTVDGKSVQWQHIRDFYDQDSSSKTGIRMAPKLTDRHFSLSMFGPLSVPLAAQVLSHTVAAGISVLAQWGILPEEAIHTAKFVEDIDQLFNAFNSRTFSSPATMRHAINKDSNHVPFLEQKLSWMQSVKSNGRKQPDCIRGWQIAIQSLLMVWECLHAKYGIAYLLTSRLNQDPVENLFSVIRHKGVQRDNPDAGQFRAAIRQCMVDAVMLPGKGKNCIEDVDRFLLTMKNVTTTQCPTATPIYHQSVTDHLPANVKSILAVCTLPADEGLTDHETNILAYIGGYIVKKIQTKPALCLSCLAKIKGSVMSDDVRHNFISAKNIQEAKCGLCAPSNALIGALQRMEIEYNLVIDQYINKAENVKATIVSSLLSNCKLQDLTCDVCHIEKVIAHLFCNIRLHHTIKITNSKLRDNKDRRNRKTLKFSHK